MYTPCVKNASDEVKSVLNYLKEISGKAIITGQHTQTVLQEELLYIRSVTKKMPALLGFELLSYSHNINYSDASDECLTEIYENRNTLSKAYEWAEKKGLITFTWHWFSPMGGRDKSFYTENTSFDPHGILIDGTNERRAFYRDLDEMAKLLGGFQKRKIPIIWRPFHEAEGDWFWWGSKGAVIAAKLYRLMFNYFTKEKGLDNLIWVWNCPLKDSYVGDEYCDIISRDVYLDPHTHTDYEKERKELIQITDSDKITALAEIGTYPDIKALEKISSSWTYYMLWSKEFCSNKYNDDSVLKEIYNSGFSVTLDKLPKLY